jgi:hypothetical protein
MDTPDREYLVKHHPELQGSYDLYAVFLLKVDELLKDTGRYGWIIPNKLLVADYAKKVYEKLSTTSLESVINVSKMPIFNGVGVYPIILIGNLIKTSKKTKKYRISTPEQLSHTEMFKEKENTFKRYKLFVNYGLKINSGTTGFEAQKIKHLISETGNGITFAVSGSIDPYTIDTSIVPYMKTRYANPRIASDSDEVATSKYNFWKSPKIVIAGMTKRIEAKFVESPLALGVGIYGIYDFGGFNPKALTAVLNSRFITYYLLKEFADKHLAGDYLAINKSTIEQLPLTDISDNTSDELANQHDTMVALKDNLNDRSFKFKEVVKSEFEVNNWPTKLNKWWTFDFTDFTKVLKVSLTLQQKDELIQLFDKYKNECSELDSRIQKTETDIDDSVYRLFGISPEEVATIESL